MTEGADATSWSRIPRTRVRCAGSSKPAGRGAKVRNIMEQLNEEGIPSPTGQGHQWTVGQVRRILSNEVYCGTILVGGRATENADSPVRVPNAFPAIISQDEFDQVQRMDE